MTTDTAVRCGRAAPVLSVNVRPVTVAVRHRQGGTVGEGDSDFSSGSGSDFRGVVGAEPLQKNSLSRNLMEVGG